MGSDGRSEVSIVEKFIINENQQYVKQKSMSCPKHRQNMQKVVSRLSHNANNVELYLYHGRYVYYVERPCCDQLNPIYDLKGNLLGYPSGGITGKGDGSFPDWYTMARHERRVWGSSPRVSKGFDINYAG